MGAEMLVFAGISGSRLDQPIEFIESRKEVDAMLCGRLSTLLFDGGYTVRNLVWDSIEASATLEMRHFGARRGM